MKTRAGYLSAVFLLLGCETTPQWGSASFGPFSACGKAYECDNLVKATIVDWQAPVKRATNLTVSPVWYTPLELKVTETRWGSLAGTVVAHYPAPIEALQLSNKSTEAWVLMRGTTERGSTTPFFWSGAAHVIVIKPDGSMDAPRGHWKTEADFLAEMDAAHADPRCAFNPNLVLGVSTDPTPDAQFFPNPTGDAGP